jgi:hypothetical protein
MVIVRSCLQRAPFVSARKNRLGIGFMSPKDAELAFRRKGVVRKRDEYRGTQSAALLSDRNWPTPIFDRKEMVMIFKGAFTAAGLVLALPLAASAQSADSKYCSALSASYEKYAQDNGGRSHNAAPANVGAAMGKCSSDPSSAIPVLEKALNEAKIPLPSRS